MYEISAMVLGVYPAEDGFERVAVKPVAPPEGFYAHGRVPMPEGYINIGVSRVNGRMRIEIIASRPIDMEITLPGTRVVSVRTDRYAAEERV
jgi:hypothetical protein